MVDESSSRPLEPALNCLEGRTDTAQWLSLVGELDVSLAREGYVLGQESIGVVNAAVSALGTPYLRTEELAATTIDCSTLTSEAHWVGAAIGIPFTSEKQRIAATGQPVRSPSDLIPGDVVIRYQSVDAPTHREYNHVGLFIGRSGRGEEWIIEASANIGVQLSSLSRFGAGGGMRRFVLSPQEQFMGEQARGSLRLARAVPRLGRFGARQYSVRGPDRHVHLGVDIYCQPGIPVHAPIDGAIAWSVLERERSQSIVITDRAVGQRSELAHVEPSVAQGQLVSAGDRVGFLLAPSRRSQIRYLGWPAANHLHFTFATLGAEHFGNIEVGEWTYHNPLYACKTGRAALPVTPSAARGVSALGACTEEAFDERSVPGQA